MPQEEDAPPGSRDPEGLPNNQESLQGVTSQEVHLHKEQLSKNDMVDNGEDWLGSERLLKMLVFKTIC